MGEPKRARMTDDQAADMATAAILRGMERTRHGRRCIEQMDGSTWRAALAAEQRDRERIAQSRRK